MEFALFFSPSCETQPDMTRKQIETLVDESITHWDYVYQELILKTYWASALVTNCPITKCRSRSWDKDLSISRTSNLNPVPAVPWLITWMQTLSFNNNFKHAYPPVYISDKYKWHKHAAFLHRPSSL